MSLNIDWNAVISNTAWLNTVRVHLARLLEEKVNTKQPGEPDDETRVHLLELEFGTVAPQFEILQLGMGGGEEPAVSSSASHARAASLDHAAASSSSSSSSLSSSPSPGPLMSSSFTSMRSTAASPGPRPRPCCSICGGVLPSSAIAVPPVTVRLRLAYTGDGYLTLQIRRQVNPFVSTQGLAGRLGRAHLPQNLMVYPLFLELWVRLSDIQLDCELEVTYTQTATKLLPPSKRRDRKTEGGAAASAVSASSLSSITATPQRMSASLTLPPRSSSRASSSSSSNLGSPRPPSAPHTPAHGTSASFSGLPSPPMSPSGSRLCTCPPPLPPAHSSAVGSTSTSVPATRVVSIKLERNPLRNLKVTSSMDESPSADKLRETLQKQVQEGLAQILGKTIDVPLPEL